MFINIILLLLLATFAILWVYCIYDVTISKFKSRNSKLLWTVLIFIFPFASVIYFASRRDLKENI